MIGPMNGLCFRIAPGRRTIGIIWLPLKWLECKAAFLELSQTMNRSSLRLRE